MGFSPYGIYQVKDTPNYDTLSSIVGLSAMLISTRFERTGETAIKLLPKSSFDSTYISGFGLPCSPINYSQHANGWEYPMLDELLPREQKQKFGMYLGTVKGNVSLRDFIRTPIQI